MTTGSPSSGRILVVGSSNTDLVCQTDRLPRPGETVPSTAFAVYAGGKAANQAVAASRAGASVAFVGCFGDDDYGRARRSELQCEGIDLQNSEVEVGAPSGLALIAVDGAGENLIITVGGANERVSNGQVERGLSGWRPAVILLPNEAPPSVVERALHTGAATNALVLLNAAPFAEVLRDMTGHVHVLICNEIEASQFLHRPVSVGSAESAVQDLAQQARRGAIITLGEHGAVGYWDGQFERVLAHPVDVTDTTGCGDAFCGAFAAWLSKSEGFDSAMRAGVVAGALAATVPGAQPSLPTSRQIEAVLDGEQ